MLASDNEAAPRLLGLLRVPPLRHAERGSWGEAGGPMAHGLAVAATGSARTGAAGTEAARGATLRNIGR